MDRNQVIEFIRRQLEAGVITSEDLKQILGPGAATQGASFMPQPAVPPAAHKGPRDMTQILYVIGAIIAIVGVGILIAQNWEEIGMLGRILATAGIALTTYVAGMLLRAPEQNRIAQIMFIIATALSPLGAYVLIDEAGGDFSLTTQTIVALALMTTYASAWFATKRNILILIVIGFASWAYYAFLINILESNLFDEIAIIKWASMLLAASYIFMGYGFNMVTDHLQREDNKAIQRVLYAFGTLGLLSFGITIGGAFDLFYILLLFAAFYGSIFLKSRSMLVLGSLFLMGHIGKLTAEYFVDSIGWPVALILIGFIVIGIGYFTFTLNKRFFAN